MDNIGSDRFALAAFSMAFTIQRILESRHVAPEAKERLIQDFTRLMDRVDLLSKIQENKEMGQKSGEQAG